MSFAVKELLHIDNCELISTEKIIKKGKTVKLVHLKYDGDTPDECPFCGSKEFFKGNGTDTANLKTTPMDGFPTNLKIKYPRKYCYNCNRLWTPNFSEDVSHPGLTEIACKTIAQEALKHTFEDVAASYDMTANTVKNIFADYMQSHLSKLRFQTPTFIGIDEINLKKIVLVTVVTDLEHRTMYDMAENMLQDDVTEFFMSLPGRENVQWICSDMHSGYRKSIEAALPNARWVIDHFHVVMKANEAMDKVRRATQSGMDKKTRIETKKGLAYTLRSRAKDMDNEEAEKIRQCRKLPHYADLMKAFDLKEDFFNIYDDNATSKTNAQEAFKKWEATIPDEDTFEPFREVAKMIHHYYDEIFAFWDCPIAITNAFTECSNRLIREDNIKGRGYSFDVLRARTLYRRKNLEKIMSSGMMLGPSIPESGAVFHSDTLDEEERYNPIYSFDEETGELVE